MEYKHALTVLGLNENFSQLELVRNYQDDVSNISENLSAETDSALIASIAEELHDLSNAYMMLRKSESNSLNKPLIYQPLIIFTDASVREDQEIATFGIVVENIPIDFELPENILKKYNIRFESGYPEELCVLSGEIANYTVDSAEIMGILAAVEIFMFLVQHSSQQIVIYTDSLTAKKVLTDKRMPANTRIYSELRKCFNKLIETNGLDIVVKKVKAHAGIEYNEMADLVAKQRNNSSQNKDFHE